MKAYKGEKHKVGGKRDGYRAELDEHKGNKQTPPRFENFKGKPIE